MTKKKKRILSIVSLVLFAVFFVLANVLNFAFSHTTVIQVLSKICFVVSGISALIWIWGSDIINLIYDKTRSEINKKDSAKYSR